LENIFLATHVGQLHVRKSANRVASFFGFYVIFITLSAPQLANEIWATVPAIGHISVGQKWLQFAFSAPTQRENV